MMTSVMVISFTAGWSPYWLISHSLEKAVLRPSTLEPSCKPAYADIDFMDAPTNETRDKFPLLMWERSACCRPLARQNVRAIGGLCLWSVIVMTTVYIQTRMLKELPWWSRLYIIRTFIGPTILFSQKSNPNSAIAQLDQNVGEMLATLKVPDLP